MGVKFAREYEDIHQELAEAIAGIGEVYAFFEMTFLEWNGLAKEEQEECIRTLTDDVFYALGSTSEVEIGLGVIRYDAARHLIKVSSQDGLTTIINLV
ncbi:hypothetical protein E0485_07500 [Paenibacillus albiflavus]|uniref:Uncharacterized protein n=1 Tax=Paenibacillus albiflavus TaxID=2545760 RepID=A0A4V2WPD0_9BACL|nr:hypothetical protein [Paenibacillus albiflavus]TCZ78902.1 hypothetical protein E0485_07500 [Paenibacillus albiflavus]